MAYVSGKRAATVEYQFSAVKRLMTEGAPNREVRASLDALIQMLREDGAILDGEEESQLGVFLASLVIIVREGFEAIIVIGAIVAYLIRSGNPRPVRIVYWSSVAAVIASFFMAYALQSLFEMSGANQEMLEGFAMLLAVVVLFFVSNWMIAKAEANAWKNYIENKVQGAIETGSIFALASAAFLAVFREGAETILFYQALFANTQTHLDMVWVGFGVGCLALVVIFILIRYGSLTIPIRQFFTWTSVLLYIMAVSFAGGGVKELQEADMVGVTVVPYIESIDLLGIYPTVETLLPQIVLLILAVLTFVHYRRKGKALRMSAGG
jgi:high-affinity iron transporter